MREPYNITFNQYRNTVTMPYIEFVVGDYMTCPLSFKWMKNDLESFNHAGTKIYLVVQTPSGKSVDDRCTINDAEAAISNILLKQDFLVEKGLHRAELQAIDIESGIVRMTSPSFSYNVRKSLQDSNTEEAKNTLTQLQEALNLVADIDVDAKLDAHDTSEIAHPHIQQELADLTTQFNEMATEITGHKAQITSEIVSFERDLSLSGTQIISGFFEKPKTIIVSGVVPGSRKFFYGQLSQNNQRAIYLTPVDGGYYSYGGGAIILSDTIANFTGGTITINSDKTITIAWTKGGSGASGIARINITAFYHGEG